MNKKIQLATVIGVILFFWLTPMLLVRSFAKNWEESGQIGDSFGMVTSLFSGMALIGVIYTVWSQRRDVERSEAAMREQQRYANEQLLQLALSTQLQSARALITEHRKAIAELNPAGGVVPTAPSLLQDLRNQILTDANANPNLRRRKSELLARLDELEALQIEITEIRRRIRPAEYERPKVNEDER